MSVSLSLPFYIGISTLRFVTLEHFNQVETARPLVG